MANDTKTKQTKKNEKQGKKGTTDIVNQEGPISKGELGQWIGGGLLCLMAILLLIAFTSNLFTGAHDQSLAPDEPAANWLGRFGVWLVNSIMNTTFGQATFVLPVFMIVLSLKVLQIGHIRLWKWLINCILVMVWLSVAGAYIQRYFFTDSYIMLGGGHGRTALDFLFAKIGHGGTFMALVLTALAYVGYLSGETVHIVRRTLEAARRRAEKAEEEALLKKAALQREGASKKDEGEYAQDEYERPTQIDLTNEGEKKPGDTATTVEFEHTPENVESKNKNEKINHEVDFEVTGAGLAEPGDTEKDGMKVHVGEGEAKAELDDGRALEPYDPKLDLSMYKYPTIDLLKKYEIDRVGIDMDEQKKNKDQILQALHNFGVEISSIKATVGPTITLYEITPAPGVRISKIRNLEDDIALSLSALGIRIIAPIPGKGTVGIEVPNAKPQMVSMESIINSRKFQTTDYELPMALGKTITNELPMVDLVKMPHLLVAGATGQGKSVGLNAIITSLLYKKHPAELKLVMVDPKKVEFSVYNPIVHHFLAQVEGNEDTDEPIITDVNKVVQTLKSLCVEMDSRYDLLKKARARNIKEYNEKFKSRQLNPNNGHRFMPYIVVVIDEFGDLIMTAGKEIELPIARIAQLARAVGIHMIIATQRPTTNIITGTIKANFPARMAFKVSAMIDSRTILDRPGANQLVGKGDMLFLAGTEPVRVQCAFVDTPEVEAIANFIACQQSYNRPFPLPPVPMEGEDSGSVADVDMNHLDPMFEEVAKLIVSTQQGSTSMIQRKFSIGFNRAGRLMDQLEKAGIVGPAQGAKPREVLVMGDVQLLEILNNLR